MLGGDNKGMNLLLEKILISIAALMIAVPVAASPRTFDTIEFKGLKYLKKEAIASGSGITVSGGKIIADTAKISEFLRKETIISTYKLIDKKNSLTIVVSEREPKFNVAVDRGGKILLCEIDLNYSIISYNLHRSDLPLVEIRPADFDSKRFSARARGFFDLLERAKKTALWNEVERAALRDDGFLDLKLRRRPTVFTLECLDESMMKVQSAAGWCDAAGRYPLHLMVRGNIAVVK
jgi:hypothetical protein